MLSTLTVDGAGASTPPSPLIIVLSAAAGVVLALALPRLWRMVCGDKHDRFTRTESSTRPPDVDVARRSLEESLVSLTSCSNDNTINSTSTQRSGSSSGEALLNLPPGVSGPTLLRKVADFLQNSDEKWLPDVTLVRSEGQNSVLRVPSWCSTQRPGSPNSDPLRAATSPLAAPLFADNGWEIPRSTLEFCRKPSGDLELLGSGAFGQVFKALKDGVQPVAVKAFPDGLPLVDIAKEVAMLKSCHDRNIVQFLGAVHDDGKTLMVIEYMEGGDLFRALNAASTSGTFMWYRRVEDGYPPGTPGLARRIALDIAKGLHCLHMRRIVHLDLKSPNVLLGRDGTAKVADVGLSKLLMDKGYCSNIINMGTLAWSAPEVLMGGRCTEKVDIFSYGVILWELVTGERPTRGGMRPVRVPEECPAPIADLIERCMSFEPDGRPTAKEIVQQLRRQDVELNHPASASKASASRASVERRRRNVQSLPLDAVVSLVRVIRGPECGFNEDDARQMVMRGLGVSFPLLYKEYISELAIWLAGSQVDEPSSAGHQRIVEVVDALRAAQPQLVAHDCQIMRRLLCGANMMTFDPTQTESAQDRDNADELAALWPRVLEALQLSPAQRARLAMAFQQRVKPTFGRLAAQRREIMNELSASDQVEFAQSVAVPIAVGETVLGLTEDAAVHTLNATDPAEDGNAPRPADLRGGDMTAAAHPPTESPFQRVSFEGSETSRSSGPLSSGPVSSDSQQHDVFADVTGVLPAEERLEVLATEWQRLSASFMGAFYSGALTQLQEARARLAAWPFTPDPLAITALIPPPPAADGLGIQSVDTAEASPAMRPMRRTSIRGTSLAGSMAEEPSLQKEPAPRT